MKVKVELEIEITGEVTEEEVKEFFSYDYYKNGCSVNNPLIYGEAKFDILDYNVEFE